MAKARILRNTGFFSRKGLYFPAGVIYCHLSHKYEKDDFCEVSLCPRASIYSAFPYPAGVWHRQGGRPGSDRDPARRPAGFFNIHPGDTLLILGSESQRSGGDKARGPQDLAEEILGTTEEATMEVNEMYEQLGVCRAVYEYGEACLGGLAAPVPAH